TTTTTIGSDPALVAPAEQSLSDVDHTRIAMHVPVMPHAESTNVTTPPARADAPRPEGTVIVERPVLRAPASEETVMADHVPAAAPSAIEIAVPETIDCDETDAADPASTTSILLQERKTVQPMDVTNARVVVPGHYLLEDECEVAFDVRVGTSMLLGRQAGSLFADDPYVDAEHTELTFRPDGVVVDDLDSTNGVFVRVRGTMTLRSGDHFRIGEQLLSFTALKRGPKTGKAPALGSPDPGYWGRVDVLIGPGTIAASYPVDDIDVGFGQTTGQVQFPDDPFVGDLHCRLVKADRTAAIEDCGGLHGTWVRLRSGDVVPYGAELMIGHTLLRLDRK
ncbi:MAG TPA: FHA domain-containing protein, partial [Nannocystaceae bacterium]|nr:FHA domain-containing protein [Nannocystaceae bacterium]